MASIFIRTLIIYASLTISMRVMGKREIGELRVGELVSSLLISEICSLPIDNPDIPLLSALIPVMFIVLLEILVSVIKNKSKALKSLFDGKPAFLIYKGEFRQKVLHDNRISIEEFFAEMRQAGVGSIDEVDYCIIEANGKISIIKKQDRGGLGHLLIADGELDERSLLALGKSTEWLKGLIGKNKIEEIFLLSVSDDYIPYIIIKEEFKK